MHSPADTASTPDRSAPADSSTSRAAATRSPPAHPKADAPGRWNPRPTAISPSSGLGTPVSFLRDGAGNATGVVYHYNGQEIVATKLP